jgi:hypothetical protein
MVKRTPIAPALLEGIEAKASQLCSLLNAMYGEGFIVFQALGALHQENLIWLAADLADDIRSAISGEVSHG